MIFRFFILLVFVFQISLLIGEELPKGAGAAAPSPFQIIHSKGGVSLYVKEKKRGKISLEESFKGHPGKDYVFRLISGGISEGVIGFYASGKGLVYVEYDSVIYLMKFDTDKKDVRIFECTELDVKK